ncbi:GreA/GreB family elongation factor [Owenweeksia hongkongensis]|uniref:GreA/GreB family elongation factor n=1 Tax=Owenweeksia hongkongensis TaxID=253245 RepID=UPI003A959E0E
MKYKTLILAKSEYDIIKDLLSKVGSKDAVHIACYNKLRGELVNAKVLEDAEIPQDVVRLNSMVDIETPSGYFGGYKVVLPKDGNVQQKKLSILTPMGSALIGYAEGDKVMWSFPGGDKEITINNVFQNIASAEEANQG